MCDSTKVLKAVTLLLKRIIRRGSAFYCYSLRLNLKWLFCLWCCNQCTCYNNSCSYIEFGNLLKVLHIIMIYDLKWFLYNSRISIKFIPNTPSTVLKILSSDAMHRKCIFLLYKEMCQMPYIVYYSTEVVITQPLTRAIIYNSPIIHRLSHRLFTISYLQYLPYLRLFTIYD